MLLHILLMMMLLQVSNVNAGGACAVCEDESTYDENLLPVCSADLFDVVDGSCTPSSSGGITCTGNCFAECVRDLGAEVCACFQTSSNCDYCSPNADTSTECAGWQADGLCQQHVSDCPTTCGGLKYQPSCLNWNPNCNNWVDQGFCNTGDPASMLLYCPGACGFNCQDIATDCVTRARNGECFNNKEYTYFYCRSTCKLCYNCYDMYTDCPSWAASGYCSSDPQNMNYYCPVSCGQCTDRCEDHNYYCPFWAGSPNYYCSSSPTSMNLTCPFSCGLCE